VKLLDLSLPAPAENLALDEALLDVCDRGGPESLRFWESPVPFVVVGYGNRIATEVNVAACAAAGVPILRRCSGGGTVVQGPGCLNYNLVLRLPADGPLATVTGTNRFIMERMRDALQPLLRDRVVVEGHTDLGVEPVGADPRGPVVRKFSGNAQRRRRHALVFHGTLLLGFDLGQIPRLLNHPSAEPGYRSGRSHLDFVANVALSAADVRHAVTRAWSAHEPFRPLPDLAEPAAKYRSTEWNERA
jgi:lipoate-protein ligase A